MTRPWLPLAALAAALPLAAPAQAPATAAPATEREKLERASEAIASMRRMRESVEISLESATGEKDLDQIGCIEEKLGRLLGLLEAAESARASLRKALASKDEGADADLAKIALAALRVDRLRAESAACMGQSAFAVDEETTVEVEERQEPPDRDRRARRPAEDRRAPRTGP